MRLPRRGTRWLEAFAVIVVLLGALVHGQHRMSPDWQSRFFYQGELGPAVMLACGHGLQPAADQPPLKAFLGLQRQSLDCLELSPDPSGSGELNAHQRAHRYQLMSIGTAWRLFGVDWVIVDRLVVALYALSCVLAYALSRLFLPRAWSLAAVGLYATGGLHLSQLDFMRDYAKAPFVLAVLLGLGWLLKRRRPTWLLMTGCGLTGVALGIGLGFRTDLLVFIPFAMGMLLLFHPVPWRESPGLRLAAPVVLLLVAWACAHPVLTSMAQGGNTAHVVLLGLARPYDDLLGLHSADYLFSAHYNDLFQQVQIDALAAALGHPRHLVLATGDYEAYGYRLLWEYARHFPADLWLRGAASVVEGIRYDAQLIWAPPRWLPPFAVLLALVGVWRHSARLGMALAVAVLFLFGLLVLQFHPRHFFHLSLVPIVCALFVARGILGWAWARWSPRSLEGRKPANSRAGRIGMALLTAFSPLLIWALLWVWQGASQTALLERVRQLPVDWLPRDGGPVALEGAAVHLTREMLSERVAQRRMRDPRGEPGVVLFGYFWVFDVDRSRPGCSSEQFRGRLVYEATVPFHDFSRSFAYFTGARARIFTPAIEMQHPAESVGSSSLAEVRIEAALWPCVERVGVAVPDARFPLLIDVRVPLDGHTRLAAVRPLWLVDALPDHRTVAVVPRQNAVHEDRFLSRVPMARAIALEDRHVQDSAVELEVEGGLSRRGEVEQKFANLVLSDPIDIGPGEAIVASGTLASGGVNLGLLRDGAWAHQVQVDQPGEFDLFIVPAPGRYQLAVANHVMRGWTNEFHIRRLGIIATGD